MTEHFRNVSLSNAAVVSAAAVVGSVAAAWGWRRSTSRRRWVRVGTLDQLCLYPLKGGKVHSVPTADFGELGLSAGVYRDRTFGFIKEKFVIRKLPKPPKISNS